MLAQLLIIEDNNLERGLYSRILVSEGYSVLEATNLQTARKLLKDHIFHVIILDVNLPDGNGLDFITELKESYPIVEIIVVTARGSISDGVKSIKLGAFDYIVKGDSPNRLLMIVQDATDIAYPKFLEELRGADSNLKKGFGAIIGESEAIIKAKIMALRVAPTNANVLLLGETGVGKDLFAEAIHYSSNRKNHNFIAINCSSIGKDMLESELFGYKAGAFTGALKDKKGLFEMANKGTIFLDEIGEMNIDLQSRILRVLQNRSFIKLGDTKVTTVDCRLIAATNVNLETAIINGSFREDLYYRLSSFIIRIPPLVERGNDLELLINHLTDSLSKQLGLNRPALTPGFIKVLKAHAWKGNVRELINVLERSIILAEGELSLDLLDIKVERKYSARQSLQNIESEHIQAVLSDTKGNKREAARRLGISISTLYRKIGQ